MEHFDFSYRLPHVDYDINDLTRRFESSAITITPPTSDMNATHQPHVLEPHSPTPTYLDPDAKHIADELVWQRTHRNEHTDKVGRLALDESYFCPIYEKNRDSDKNDSGLYKGDDDIMMKDVTYNETEKEQIMQADPMWVIPPNFKTEWVMVVCPVGTRCLVTTGNGQTVARSVDGSVINRFQSNLPNGSIHRSEARSFCILDCIYDVMKGIFYILDVMCWEGQSIYQLSTDLRHHFITTSLRFLNTPSRHTFKLLDHISLDHLDIVIANLNDHLTNSLPWTTYTVDSLLFYHRATEYVGGTTSLARWLSLDRLSCLKNIPC